MSLLMACQSSTLPGLQTSDETLHMQITITNETEDCTVKLLSRHWIIKNSQGHTEEVRWVCPWPALFM